jgi:hypothetical protein
MRRGAHVHDELHDLQRQVATDAVHFEVAEAVVALEVAPLALDGMLQVRVDGLERERVVVNAALVVGHGGGRVDAIVLRGSRGAVPVVVTQKLLVAVGHLDEDDLRVRTGGHAAGQTS